MAAATITWPDTAPLDELDHAQINSVKAAINDHAGLLDAHGQELAGKEAAGTGAEVLTQAKAYTDQQVISAPKVAGPYDASTNPGYPTVGTGASGAVRRGDTFNISVAGTVGGIPVEYGDALQALVAMPGQVAGNWQILQANLFTATETVAGTSKVATAAQVQNEASTEDAAYLTAKKLWGAFVPRFAQLARTISGLWNFTVSPTVPVATLPEHAMRYGQRLQLGTSDTTAAAGNHTHSPDDVLALNAAGLPLLAATMVAKPWGLTQASALTNGTLRLIPVFLPASITVTGVTVYLAAAGVFTAVNENSFSLYSLSAGILTRVASTINNGALFMGTAQSYVQGAFTAPYLAAPGLYYIGILYAASPATTAPSLGAAPNVNNVGMTALPGGKLLPTLPSQTATPASVTITSTGNSNNPLWAGLY